MGILPCAIGWHSNEESQTKPSIHLQSSSSESSSLSSQPSLPTVPSLISNTHRPSTHHQCISTLKGHSSHVFALAISGKFLYSGSSDSEVRIWDIHPSQPTSPNASNPTNVVAVGRCAVKSIAILRGRLLSAHQDNKIRVWEIDYNENRNRNRNSNYKLLATLPTLKDRLLRFLPPKNHVQVRRHKKRTWVHHVDAVSALAVSADGSTLYSVSWDRTLKIWRSTDFRCLESVAKAHDDAINALAISHDGFIYTGSADTRIKVWKKLSGEKKHSLQATLEKHKSAVNALALNSDGSVLYSGACDRSIVVWERDERNGINSSGGHMVVVGALRGHVKAILCLAVVSDMVCSGSADRTVRIWRRGVDQGYSCLAILEGHGAPVKCLAAGEDRYGAGSCGTSLLVYSGSLDCAIKVWQLLIPDIEEQVLQ